jgi:hypothetical protein
MHTTSINLASIHVGMVIQEFKKCGKFDIKLKAKYLGVWMRKYDATLTLFLVNMRRIYQLYSYRLISKLMATPL